MHFYVYRGLHSYSQHHVVDPKQNGTELYPLAPWFPSLTPEQWFKGADYYAQFTDFVQFPHLLRFRTVAELFRILDTFDQKEVNRNMRKFSNKVFAKSVKQWSNVMEQYLSVADPK